MVTFPDHPAFTGYNAPMRAEIDIAECETEGAVPADLDGAFYRVGPDPQYPPRLGQDIYFNGDGMVSMFRFKGGKVSLKQRYVRTEKFNLERHAGKGLFGAYRNPFTDDDSVKGRSRGTANTNVMLHGGRMFAFKEDSPPVEMDPVTLETRGSWDFFGKLKSETFTSHAKIDPGTGEMIGFGYGAKGVDTPDVAYYVINPQGEIVHEVWFQVPYPNLMHDFGVTRDYVIFPIVPVCSSIERAKRGESVFMWDGSKDVYLGVLPRRGEAKDLRWFRAPNRFASHVMNAFNEGTKVHIDMPVAEGNMFPFFPDVTGAPFNPAKAAARMTRWTVDMSSNEPGFESAQLGGMVGEFPKIDERYATQPYRHGFMCVVDPTKPFTPKGGSITGLIINTIGHVDHATGKEDGYWIGEKSSFQEPCFVPRSKNAPEGDGYLMVVVNRYEEMRSDLMILDAQHLAEGPLATVRLPFRLRNGLHGNWYDGNLLSN